MENNAQLKNSIARSISAATNQTFSINGLSTVSGGCINSAYIAQDQNNRFFIKLNSTDSLAMFEAEHQALLEIENANSIRVPHPVCTGSSETHSWIVLEFLPLQINGDQELLGEQLAAMHKNTQENFGWERDNTIGFTPQINTPSNNWQTFFRENRLRYQLNLAAANGYTGTLQQAGATLLECMTDFFVGYNPTPSLLHGDLWSGNFAFIEDDTPVIYDPALYYGDRETDIAMTELFGGFDLHFRHAYESCWPLDAGFKTRRKLYNCYHILNHLNLFGGGYAQQAEELILGLLSERNA